MQARRVPAPMQFVALLALLCMVLFIGMWSASQLGLPVIARVFNVLMPIGVFVELFFVVTIVIVMLTQFARKLFEIYVSR